MNFLTSLSLLLVAGADTLVLMVTGAAGAERVVATAVVAGAERVGAGC